jgi:hypothetical protein
MELQNTRLSIISFFSLCSRGFESSIAALENAKDEFLEQLSVSELKDERGRLRVWAANSGAHREGRVSLDHKLRYSTHIHKKITDLLQELNTALQDGA